jgi:replicative DNA helicase
MRIGKPFERRVGQSFSDSSFEHGKVQPQAVDIEEAILGSMMLEKNSLNTAINLIKTEEIFYRDQNKTIFKAISSLCQEYKEVDILTVSNKLAMTGDLELAGGRYYITQLTNNVSSSANIEFHIAIVTQKWLSREMIRVGSEMIKTAFEDSEDVFDVMDHSIIDLMELYNSINVSNTEHVGDIAESNAKLILNIIEHKTELIGLRSGFTLIDMVTNGFQNGDFIIIAGRPGMGKTAFGVSLLLNMSVMDKIPIGFISLEMTKSQVVMRLQSMMVGMTYQDLRGGRISDSKMEKFNIDLGTLHEATAYVDDTASMTIVQLRAKVMDMVKKHGVKMVMIDYLQLMSGVGKRNQNREQEVSDISRGLKALAKELNIPIIAFSQLSRKVEDRGGDKKPKLSDLRESGAIEQDADLVMFLWRPEYYGIQSDDMGNDFTDIGVVMIEKHRNGSTGEFRLAFKKALMQYTNFGGDVKEMPSDRNMPGFFDEVNNKEDLPF